MHTISRDCLPRGRVDSCVREKFRPRASTHASNARTQRTQRTHQHASTRINPCSRSNCCRDPMRCSRWHWARPNILVDGSHPIAGLDRHLLVRTNLHRRHQFQSARTRHRWDRCRTCRDFRFARERRCALANTPRLAAADHSALIRPSCCHRDSACDSELSAAFAPSPHPWVGCSQRLVVCHRRRERSRKSIHSPCPANSRATSNTR